MIRTKMRSQVNCESCDYLCYLYDRADNLKGYLCDKGLDVCIDEFRTLEYMDCHSLHEYWEYEYGDEYE